MFGIVSGNSTMGASENSRGVIPEPKRIAVVSSEVLGMEGTGGAATADSLLAIALGRSGHHVDLLVAPGREVGELTAAWTERYQAAGVRIRPIEANVAVTPAFLGPTAAVLQTLREEPPDVVIGDDWRGVNFAPLSMREAGLAFADTAFVVHCHAPGTMLAEFARKVPDRAGRFGQEVAERAAVELADAVVSPSEWLLGWMEDRGWPTPKRSQVIPHVWLTAALGEPPVLAETGMPVQRLAFFGQIREGKGVRVFLSSINAVEPSLLDGIELVFVGRLTRRWTAERIESSLNPRVAERIAELRFETTLDPPGALEELRRPGTLTIVPSLLDNAPYPVSECLEHGIPCLASDTGGTPELIAESDRERVLFEPTTSGLAAAVERALRSPDGVAPARSAVDPEKTVEAWLDLVASVTPAPRRERRPATLVAVIASTAAGAERAQRLAERTQTAEVETIQAESRRAGLARSAADWVVFLDDDDSPDDTFVDTLVAAQAAANADVVTSAVRSADGADRVQLFLGNPGALGLVENQYGVVGLVRSELAAADALPDEGVDPDWPLLARLALGGAKVVSVPEPLSTHRGKPGHVGDVPGEGLDVLRAFEQQGANLRGLPQLAATLAAANLKLEEARVASSDGHRGLPERIAGRVRRTLASRRRAG
jgi:glycosyltransferase involved in cell wall biosynthesis